MNKAIEMINELNNWIACDANRIKKVTDRRGRLSNTKLLKNDFFDLVKNQFQTDIYPHFRELKIRIEGDVRYEEIDSIYLNNLTQRASFYRPEKITDLFHKAPNLYREIGRSGYTIWVIQSLELEKGQLRYWHLPDHFLLALAEPYGSFTTLHNSNKELRRHIKARGLDEALIRRAPVFGKHFYTGLAGRQYRSLAELVAGNILESSGLTFQPQYKVPLEYRQGRPRYCDFYLPEKKLLIEIEQCTSGNRGSRRDSYVRRTKEKYREYEKEGFHYITVDSDTYYSSCQGFKAENFAKDFKNKIKESTGTEIPIPPVEKMMAREVSEDISIILKSSKDDAYKHITQKMGIQSVARLQNHNSPILKALRQRADKGKEIVGWIKKESLQKRNEKMKQYHQLNRDNYSHIQVAIELARQQNIRSQDDWFSWCKANPVERDRLGIPANVASVYRQKGQWISWTHFLGNTPKK